MTILSYQSIVQIAKEHPDFISPFCADEMEFEGTRYGCGAAGYSVRISQDVTLNPGEKILVSTIETFSIPHNVKGCVCNKSSWARMFLSVFNTRIQPGWRGNLTVELINLGSFQVALKKGMAISEIEFYWLDYTTVRPYQGYYQAQSESAKHSVLQP